MRFTLPFVLMLACAGGASRPAAAEQTGSVSGRVFDVLSGGFVNQAAVVLEAPTFQREVRSEVDGKFLLADVPTGEYHLIVRADGYLVSRTELTVVPGAQTTDVLLNPELHFTEVTSVSPTATSQFETFQATNVLGGQELTKQLLTTLGATIEGQPGMAVRSAGPGSARPVVRGMDGDRVLIVEDGMRMGDLSSQSGDHGINVNPASASRIEVVRGPATLLYGSNALGGLVNVITKDIPDAPVTTPAASFTIDAGSGAKDVGGAGDVTLGNGRVALHLSGSGRRSSDFRSPDGDVPNSFSRAAFAETGLAYTAENSYFGGSYKYDRTRYGIPLVEAGRTNLTPRRQILTLRGESRNRGGFIDSIRGSFGIRRYKHDERDGEEVETSFRNNTAEVELLAHHKGLGRMKGSFGGTLMTRAFSTEGAESLSPPVDQRAYAAYLYEEVAAADHVDFQFGVRFDRTDFTPDGGEVERHFTNFSGSLGLLLSPTETTTVAFSFARAARNPALEELYFHGPHVGNNAFENGNAALESEHALGFDLSVRLRSAAASGEVTFFLNHLENFIFRQLTGRVEDGLPEVFFVQGDARVSGIESHLDVKLTDLLSVEGGVDYLRGDLRSLDVPLPRMPPLRGRVGLRLQKSAFQAGGDLSITARQDRIYAVAGEDGGTVGETPTDGYNVGKLYSSYSFVSGRTEHTITVRLDNVTDTLYRNHLNYLKDLTPEMGRNLKAVYNVKF